MKTLADPLPLRTSDEWLGRRESVPLAVRIGRTRGKLTQYDQARTKFVWAGHACQGVDTVFSGGLPIDGWVFTNEPDSAGKIVAMVTFAAPQPEGADLTASGRGMMDGDAGHLIENPADALFAILNVLGGLVTITRAALAPFRTQCAALGLPVGGSIETLDSGQTVARAIAESVGAKFGPTARSIGFLWPNPAPGVARLTVGATGDYAVTRENTAADLCTDLTVQYDFDGDQPRGSVRLVAPAQARRYGSAAQTLAAKWLTSSAAAQAVGMRLLAHSARKQWLITVEKVRSRELRIGDAIALRHDLANFPGTYPVLSRERSDDLETMTVTARVPIGPAPVVAIASQSTFFDPNAYVSLESVPVGQDHGWVIRDENGIAAPGSTVQILPSGPTRQADGTGLVVFTDAMMPTGHHYELGATLPDGRYFTFGVDV